MNASNGLDRRSFFRRLGGGIIVLVAARAGELRSQPVGPLYPEDFNAYLLIGENGRVTVYSGKIEMGQGAMTAQAQMAAEELGVDLDAIEMVLGDTDRCPWDMGTFGSLTVRMFGPALRAAAARARRVLIELAARQLGVTPERLVVAHGRVAVTGEPERSIGFGQLSKGAGIAHVVDAKAVLRAAANFSVMGRSPQRLDAVDKVTGAARYAADIRRPGMLCARVLRPPAHGAALIHLDLTAAARLPGVSVVQRDDLVAMLHADPESAQAALARVVAEWKTPPATLDTESIFDHIAAATDTPKQLLDRGQPAAARARATKQFSGRYEKGYVAHAAIEPHAALAEFDGGRCTVWASTQTPFPTRDRIARRLGLATRNVRVITPFVGGGFGGKSADAQAVEAARLAQITGRPVQVAWTRGEEFFNDTFDPAAVVTIAAGVDAGGRIVYWDHVVHAAGERAAVPLYELPDARILSLAGMRYADERPATPVHPLAVGAWRAPGANMNVFAIESQIDALAAAAAIDPLDFRLRNLADARMRRVLQAAAAAFGWQARPAPSGRGFGLACAVDAGTYVAAMAEVGVDAASGRIAVKRVVCAQDMGIVVNPEGARMQIEGAVTMGLGYTLSEELRFRGGEILDRNFDSYEIPGFASLPRIEAVLVADDAVPPQGGGEPPITITGAVVANAVFDATGVRMVRLPMTAARVREAIARQRAGLPA